MKKSAGTMMASRIDVVWRGLLMNRCKINLKDIPQVIVASISNLFFLPFHIAEYISDTHKLKRIDMKDPVFVLGHWRSGTTLLHYMLAQDKTDFSFIDPLTGYGLNTFLLKRILKKSLPQIVSEWRPMDNMNFREDLPYEEYMSMTLYSPYACWTLNIYPQSRYRYLDYAFVDEMPQKIRRKWIKDNDRILKKYASQIGLEKPLVLKSPDSNARVKFLSEHYPNSKFINIYRNPYAMIRSTIHMYEKVLPIMSIQKNPTYEELETFAIDGFKRIYQKYFDDIEEIEPDRIVDIKFEDFEIEPLPILQEVYRKFDWDWEAAMPAIKSYWQSLEGYKKNVFDYTPHLIERINDELDFYFEHYGYEKMPVPKETFYK